MKILITALVLLSSFSSFASTLPAVGTYSEYKIFSRTHQGKHRIEVVDYDENTEFFTSHLTTEFNGDIEVYDYIQHKDQIKTEEDTRRILRVCEHPQINGVLETIKVPAGEFLTCRVVSKDYKIYYMAAVPFGYVKAITREGFIFELTSFEFK